MNATELLCKRPGCSGKIVDGVCEDCGRPPAGQSLLTDGAGTGTVGTAATGTGTRATGSRRATRSAQLSMFRARTSSTPRSMRSWPG